jgi:hypothetical protein
VISTRLVDWIVDLLHCDLNLGKLTWKWALIRKLPPLVRAEISEYLSSIGLGLDLRTKEEGRQAQEKFYDGGVWHTFCVGGKKNPPGPKIVAKILHMIALHYDQLQQEHDDRCADATATAAAATTAAATATAAAATTAAHAKPPTTKQAAASSKPKMSSSKPQRGAMRPRGGAAFPLV